MLPLLCLIFKKMNRRTTGYLTFIVLGTLNCPIACAYDFFAHTPELIEDQENLPENKDLNQTQKHLAEQHEQDVQHYELLKNPFYSNERLSIYNYTAYSADALKNNITGEANPHISVNALSISFGYGMRYMINSEHKIGYEYISSFPYDRGQLIRIFWIWSF